jgi:hypothetical protein
MGLFNPGSGTGGTRARAQRLEMVIGILGFFTLLAAIQTVVLEVRGESAVAEALILAAFSVLLWLAIRARRRIDV